MIRILLAIFCLCGGILTAPRAMAGALTPAGHWLTSDGQAVIAIAACGGSFCGRIAGVALDHPSDPMPRDWRGQPQCGDQIVTVSSNNAQDQWQGTVTDPRDGSSYQAILTLKNGILHLRGYIGLPVFGQTQDWTRYSGQINPGCRITAAG